MWHFILGSNAWKHSTVHSIPRAIFTNVHTWKRETWCAYCLSCLYLYSHRLLRGHMSTFQPPDYVYHLIEEWETMNERE